MTRCSVVAAACLLVSRLAGQDARAFCDPAADPRNACPGQGCVCIEDVLRIGLQPGGGSTIELEDLPPDLRLEALVILETKSMSVQGWAYVVGHDGHALSIESVAIEGTDARRLMQNGFNATKSQDLTDCAAHPNRCSGFISMVALSLTEPVELPLGTNSLARAIYRLEPAARDVAEAGILLLEFTEVGFTVAGRSARPKTVVDGRILLPSGGTDFHRGDPDGDGRLSVADAVALLLFLFLAGPAPGCLESGDLDDDGRIDTTDPVLVLRWLFLGGSAPAPPGPPPAPCGPDTRGAGQELGCDSYAGC